MHCHLGCSLKSFVVLLLMQMSSLSLQSVGLALSKRRHRVTRVSHVLPTPIRWNMGLCFVPARMASSGPQPTPLLDPAQVRPVGKKKQQQKKTFEMRIGVFAARSVQPVPFPHVTFPVCNQNRHFKSDCESFRMCRGVFMVLNWQHDFQPTPDMFKTYFYRSSFLKKVYFQS